MHFLLRSYVQYEKTDFFTPHSTYYKIKSFHLLEGTVNFYEHLKGQKWKKLLKIWKNSYFYKQILDFHCRSEILCHTSML